jgi:hypothetical protein
MRRPHRSAHRARSSCAAHAGLGFVLLAWTSFFLSGGSGTRGAAKRTVAVHPAPTLFWRCCPVVGHLARGARRYGRLVWDHRAPHDHCLNPETFGDSHARKKMAGESGFHGVRKNDERVSSLLSKWIMDMVVAQRPRRPVPPYSTSFGLVQRCGDSLGVLFPISSSIASLSFFAACGKNRH